MSQKDTQLIRFQGNTATSSFVKENLNDQQLIALLKKDGHI